MRLFIHSRKSLLSSCREQEAAADAAHEKVVHEIIEGKRRGKRRDRGIGLSDNDESDDSDIDRKRLYPKKRKIKIDDLEDLGQWRNFSEEAEHVHAKSSVSPNGVPSSSLRA